MFQQRHPPDSIPTDITPPQLVSIQEKGVSAFEFEWEPDANCFVAARTEIQFIHGESCVQTNLPLPRNQEVYYWEVGHHPHFLYSLLIYYARPKCLIFLKQLQYLLV